MELPELIASLAARPGPVLTWYGEHRTELGGAVAARWLAKTANLLSGDLAGDLFGAGSDLHASGPHSVDGGDGEPDDADGPSPMGTIRVNLGASWQSVIWLTAAWLSGWRSVPGRLSSVHEGDTASPAGESAVTGIGSTSESDAGGVDVWVTDRIGPEHLAAVDAGCWVLAQATAPLALSWPGPLPEGVLDALAELAAQSDALEMVPEVDPGTVVMAPRPGVSDALPLRLRDLGQSQGEDVPTPAEGGPLRVLMTSMNPTDDSRSILVQWVAGRSVVLVDPRFHDARTMQRIAESEHSAPLI